MSSPVRSQAAAAADDWLSSLDDVLGPDDGAGLPYVPPSHCTSPDTMRWTADPALSFAPAGTPSGGVLRGGTDSATWDRTPTDLIADPRHARELIAQQRSVAVAPDVLEYIRAQCTVPAPAFDPGMSSVFGVPIILDPTLPPGTVEPR